MGAAAAIGSAVIGGIASKKAAKKQAQAAERSAEIQAQSGREAQAQTLQAQREARQAQLEAVGRARPFLDPYAQALAPVTQQVGLLTDPQQQFQYLQQNPLFQMAIENANKQTMQQAAARGRISAGDTLQQLSQNVLLSAQPLLAQQQQNIANLLGQGIGVAGSRANLELGLGSNLANLATQTGRTLGGLTTDIGAAQAAGQIGAANQRAQGQAGLIGGLQTGATLAQQNGLFKGLGSIFSGQTAPTSTPYGPAS